MNAEISTLQEKVNAVCNLTAYLNLMASFAPEGDFKQIKNIIVPVYDFMKGSTDDELNQRIPEIKMTLDKMAAVFINKYPLKKDMSEIASDFDSLFKNGYDVYANGLTFGWLNDRMDITSIKLYVDTPYHYQIGLAAHKGNGSVEEDFLLKDAFDILIKAEYTHNLLISYGTILKENEENGKIVYNQIAYTKITNIKHQVAAYSRLSIISFYAFVESFVNSVGYSYLQQNALSLSEEDKETLKGLKKGRYLQLKSKIEKFQSIIRTDLQVKLNLSDEKQVKEPFKTFFAYYEELRNAAVHYSRFKERIWLAPKDWTDKATEFSKVSTSVALEFWKACYPESDGPTYLGKLDTALHIDKAKKRMESIKVIEKEVMSTTSIKF